MRGVDAMVQVLSRCRGIGPPVAPLALALHAALDLNLVFGVLSNGLANVEGSRPPLCHSDRVGTGSPLRPIGSFGDESGGFEAAQELEDHPALGFDHELVLVALADDAVETLSVLFDDGNVLDLTGGLCNDDRRNQEDRKEREGFFGLHSDV